VCVILGLSPGCTHPKSASLHSSVIASTLPCVRLLYVPAVCLLFARSVCVAVFVVVVVDIRNVLRQQADRRRREAIEKGEVGS
jgi:hypothetical protein